MLRLPKHLARIVRTTYPSGASEMLRQAQHDVLFFINSLRSYSVLAVSTLHSEYSGATSR